jgi:hypothetical protein
MDEEFGDGHWELIAPLLPKPEKKYLNNIEKLAVVGKYEWEEWLTTLSQSFSSGGVRYFDESRTDEAKEWVQP